MTQTSNEPGRTQGQDPHRRWPGRGRNGATSSRVGSIWVAFILFAVVLLLLLIFVLQNGQRAHISYFGAHGDLPQGVALLLAAVFGTLLVALPGTGRIIQLRMRDRRHRGLANAQPPVTRPAIVGPPVPGPASPPVDNTAARTPDPVTLAAPDSPTPYPTAPTPPGAQGTSPPAAADRP